MAIINPWTAIAAGKAVWNGYKWVKQMKKLKKGGGSTVEKIQSGTKPKGKKMTEEKAWARDERQIEYFKEGPHKRSAKTGKRMPLPVDAYRK
jgi:hypothetical protein